MNADISAQEQFYRRGLVLGFTLAEVAVLIIFALLLALSWHLAAKEKKIDGLSQTLKEREAAVVKLTEHKRVLEERVARGDDFDDLFRELEQVKEQRAVGEQANVALREKVETLKEKNEVLEDRTAITEKLMKIARKAGMSAEDPEKTFEKFASQLEGLKKIKEEMKAAGLDDSQTKDFLRNAQRKLDGLGKGTEMPACWTSRDTGKPEYIFNTALTSVGIIIQDNTLPHRVEEQAQLPLLAMVFNKEVRPEQFQVITRAVYDWSVKKKCRFFVRVYDLTKEGEKKLYKYHLRTVGEHFYYFEVLNGAFRVADDRS